MLMLPKIKWFQSTLQTSKKSCLEKKRFVTVFRYRFSKYLTKGFKLAVNEVVNARLLRPMKYLMHRCVSFVKFRHWCIFWLWSFQPRIRINGLIDIKNFCSTFKCHYRTQGCHSCSSIPLRYGFKWNQWIKFGLTNMSFNQNLINFLIKMTKDLQIKTTEVHLRPVTMPFPFEQRAMEIVNFVVIEITRNTRKFDTFWAISFHYFYSTCRITDDWLVFLHKSSHWVGA